MDRDAFRRRAGINEQTYRGDPTRAFASNASAPNGFDGGPKGSVSDDAMAARLRVAAKRGVRPDMNELIRYVEITMNKHGFDLTANGLKLVPISNADNSKL